MSITVVENEFLWEQKYRPQTISECILTDSIMEFATNTITNGQIQNLLLAGTAGIGKTTIATAIANDIGCTSTIINCSKENGIDTIRTKITQFATTKSLNGKPKIIIMDEADGLSVEAQKSLRAAQEEFSKNCRFIFTCNYKNKLISPLHSRLTSVDFTIPKEERPAIAAKMYKRVVEILNLEGVTFDKKVVAKVVNDNFPDFRSTLKQLQRLAIESNNNIDEFALAAVAKEVAIDELVSALKDKDFKRMRQWVANSANTSSTETIVRSVFDSLNTVAQPSCIPNLILILSEYSYKSAFVADHELNLTAMFIEIMANGEWK